MSDVHGINWFGVALDRLGITFAEYQELAAGVLALDSEVARVFERVRSGQAQAWALVNAIEWAGKVASGSRPSHDRPLSAAGRNWG